MHFENSNACNSHYYVEERIYDGFITMVNKLRFGEIDIIGQTLEKLESVAVLYKKNNQMAKDMSKEIAELNAKILMLDELQAKGYLANEIYQIQTREIRKQIGEIKIQRHMTYESKITDSIVEIKRLKELIDEIEEPMEEFDQGLFEQIVCEMTVSKKDELTITLLGGLKLTELI